MGEKERMMTFKKKNNCQKGVILIVKKVFENGSSITQLFYCKHKLLKYRIIKFYYLRKNYEVEEVENE